MEDRLPLADVSGDEALARIAYQIIIGDYQLHPDAYDTPSNRLLILADQWHHSGLAQIAGDIRLAALWCANGGTVATWLRSRITYRAGRSRANGTPTRRPN